MNASTIRIMELVAAFGNKVWVRARQAANGEVLASASPEEDAIRVAVEELVAERDAAVSAANDILKVQIEEMGNKLRMRKIHFIK